MQIGNRQLPYPVINRFESLNCYKESRFRFVHLPTERNEETDEFVIPGACYETNSDTIKMLLAAGKIGIMMIVECPDTVYRRHWELTEEPTDIKIPFSDLKGKLSVSAFAYSKEPINDFTDPDLSPEFEGLLFEIEKNGFMAIDDGFTVNANHAEKADDYVSSFVTVSKKPADDGMMDVVLKENKIDIQLPPDQYDIYDQTKQIPQLRTMYFGMMLIPALADAFTKLKSMVAQQGYGYFDDFYDEFNWAKSLAASYKKRVGKELTIEELNSLEPLKVAQIILDKPTVRSVQQAYELAFNPPSDD